MTKSQCSHVRFTACLLRQSVGAYILKFIVTMFQFDLSTPVPCPPTSVSAVHTCRPNPVPVSWVASDSATHYTALAVSDTGHRAECRTNTTSCNLSGLRCGEVYTLGVSGADDNCTGLLSDTVSLNTGKATLPISLISASVIQSISKSQIKSETH